MWGIKIYRVSTLFISLILMSACQPGPSILVQFKSPLPTLNKCNDLFSGDWKMKTVVSKKGQTVRATAQNSAANLWLRMRVLRDCEGSSVSFAVKEKEQSLARGMFKMKLTFFDQQSFKYLNLHIKNQDKNIWLIYRYRFLDNNTLEVKAPNREFIIQAIKNKNLRGNIEKPYDDPNVTASSAGIEIFLRKYSNSIFKETFVYERIQKTKWDMRKMR